MRRIPVAVITAMLLLPASAWAFAPPPPPGGPEFHNPWSFNLSLLPGGFASFQKKSLRIPIKVLRRFAAQSQRGQHIDRVDLTREICESQPIIHFAGIQSAHLPLEKELVE